MNQWDRRSRCENFLEGAVKEWRNGQYLRRTKLYSKDRSRKANFDRLGKAKWDRIFVIVGIMTEN